MTAGFFYSKGKNLFLTFTIIYSKALIFKNKCAIIIKVFETFTAVKVPES